MLEKVLSSTVKTITNVIYIYNIGVFLGSPGRLTISA